MAPIRNAAVIFSEIPTGYPKVDKHIKYVTDRTIDIDAVDTEGGIIVKNLVVSIDPYMRGRMREAGMKSYTPPFELNQPLTNFIVGRVVRSNNAHYKVGQLVHGFGGYEEYTVHPKDALEVIRVLTEAELKLNLPLTVWVGAAGMSGQAAFYGFYQFAEAKKGERIFISGAAGAVGQIVGQLGELFSVRKGETKLFI